MRLDNSELDHGLVIGEWVDDAVLHWVVRGVFRDATPHEGACLGAFVEERSFAVFILINEISGRHRGKLRIWKTIKFLLVR